MVDERAQSIGVKDDASELDTVAQKLFGRAYTQLSDAEAAQVWDVIEAAEAAEAGQ